MKKKIIIAVSVLLAVAALVTGWVFWKMSKNPDKNVDIPLVKTEFTSEHGVKFTFSPETKTLTVFGTEIENEYNVDLFGDESGLDYWFENAEKIVFAEGVTKSFYSFKEFEKIKTVELCTTMQYFIICDFPYLENYVVREGCKNFFSDENGVLYSVSYSGNNPEEYIYLNDIPVNSPITEFVIPGYVDELVGSKLKKTNYIKKVIIGKDFEGKINGGIISVCDIDSFEVHTENQKYCSDEQGVLYSKDKTIIYGIPSTLEELVMPENSNLAYSNDDETNDKIKKVTISNVPNFFDYNSLGIFSALEEVVVPENNTGYYSVDGVVFSKDMSMIEYYPRMKPVETYEIPSTVVTVGYRCFSGNKTLRHLIIPDSVTTVCAYAFYNMDALETVKIGKGLKTFEMIDPMHTRFEYENPFDTCDNLKFVSVDKGNPHFCSDAQGALYTKDMRFLLTVPAGMVSKEFTVPDAVKEITYAFTNCAELEDINIGSGLESVFIYLTFDGFHYYGFKNCASLREIDVSADNPYFESIDGVLYSEGGKTLVMYPPSKEGDTFVVPDSVTDIEWKAFRLNKYIEKLYVGKNVESFENYYGSFPYFANDDNYNMMFDVYYEGELRRTIESDRKEPYSVYYNSTMPH